MLPPPKTRTRLGNVPIALTSSESHADVRLLGLDNSPRMSQKTFRNPAFSVAIFLAVAGVAQTDWTGHGEFREFLWVRGRRTATSASRPSPRGMIDLKESRSNRGATNCQPIDQIAVRCDGDGRVSQEADDGRAQTTQTRPPLLYSTRPKISSICGIGSIGNKA